MRAAVMRRDDLDVLMLPAAVRLLILDPQVGKMHLASEVRQIVLDRPVADLLIGTVRVPVVVVTLAVARM